ncbi:FBD-associated F-box protein [Trifolium repens]|nr:FBD-associated F-box protein [Trifolium repens]
MSSGEKKKCSGELTTTTIESLPNSVLRHILSFLPTNEAVATCLLSKRWIPQWLELQSLHLDETYHPDFDSFCNFVHSVLSAINRPFQSLSITSSVHDVRGIIQVRDLDTILHATWWKEIQQLDLRMTTTSILLPDRFYRCKTQVIQCYFGLPNPYRFSTTQILNFD